MIPVEAGDSAGMKEEWVRRFPATPPARQSARTPVKIPGLQVFMACIAEA